MNKATRADKPDVLYQKFFFVIIITVSGLVLTTTNIWFYLTLMNFFFNAKTPRENAD